MARSWTVLLALTVALASASASAQRSSTTSAAAAESLFQEGKVLMARGDYAAACPKLAESQRLDPGGGTLVALALCHEGLGKTASAWAEFMEVVATARRDARPDREKFARAHAVALEPLLSRLSIEVPPEVAATPGLTIARDGEEIGQATWGSELPIDPGEHVVLAKAPGKRPWSTTVTVGKNGERRILSVPSLTDAPATLPASVAPPFEPRGGTSRAKLFGLLLGGGGLASVAAGSFFGIEAIVKSSDAKSQCPSSKGCSAATLSENDTAKTDALVADFTIGAGVVAIGVGIAVVLTSHGSEGSGPPRDAGLTPFVTRDGAGVAWSGSW